MSLTSQHHERLKNLLRDEQWEEAEAFWLELADQWPEHPEFLIPLAKEFADAGQPQTASQLLSLITPQLKASGKNHEWLYALKLQAFSEAPPNTLRDELQQAYEQIYQDDPRLKTILGVTGLGQSTRPLPDAVKNTDTLLVLKPETYCEHKSWGFGRVKSFDATLQRIVVAFPHSPEHPMQLAYAADSVTPITSEHIEVRKQTDLESLKQMATADPVGLIRIVLLSHGRAATAERIEAAISGSVVPVDQWKKWWEGTRKLLKRNPHFDWPAKKTEPVRLRTAPVSQQDELLDEFRTALSLPQKTAAARQLLKAISEIENPDLILQEFQDGLLDSIRKARPSQQAEPVEAACLLEELHTHQHGPSEDTAPLCAELLCAASDLPGLLDELSPVAHKRAIALLKTTQPDLLLKNLNRLSARSLTEIADLLVQVPSQIIQHVRNQTGSLELLYWLCSSFAGPGAATWMDTVPRPALLAAIINAIEAATARAPTKKLRDLLLSQEALVADLLAEAPTDTVRDLARQLLHSSAFEELDRRLLMARLVKEFPFVQELLVSRTIKEQPLVVSWPSLERRKAELDDIIQKKIPQNSREIAQARSYGDLRENFEYKAAKDMQKLLMRRRAELEVLLTRAQGTDFANAKTDTIQIGTSVTVTDLATNQSRVYHILGAWDSNPDRGIISYPAALAQSLLNKPVGEIVEAASDTGTIQLRIDAITMVSADILSSL